METEIHEYDVALSFAGEDRRYVEEVSRHLRRMGIRCFYDKSEEVDLWGKNLYEYLTDIYSKKSRYTVMFVSSNYANKMWTNLERRSAQERAFLENSDYILPVRFDDTEIPGLLKTIGYVDLRIVSPEDLAFMIKKKVGPLQRKNFFPEDLDLLYKYFKAKSKKRQSYIREKAYNIFEMLKLMTDNEKKFLSIFIENCCPAGLPEDVHINIDYLQRLVDMSKEEIISLVSGLRPLWIVAKMSAIEDEEKYICGEQEVLRLECLDSSDDFCNITSILEGVFTTLKFYQCPHCASNAIKNLDFSALSSVACNPEH